MFFEAEPGVLNARSLRVTAQAPGVMTWCDRAEGSGESAPPGNQVNSFNLEGLCEEHSDLRAPF